MTTKTGSGYNKSGETPEWAGVAPIYDAGKLVLPDQDVLTALYGDQVLDYLKKDYSVYAPKCFSGGGRFSDTDCVRYGEIDTMEEVEFEKKSEFSFKEILLPVSQTLFFYTEDSVKESDPEKKGAVVFLRSCDLHAVKRLDDMYLKNGPEDFYYRRVRERIHFVLMGCEKAYDTCFCVDMGTNRSENYDVSIDKRGDKFYLDCRWDFLTEPLEQKAEKIQDVTPAYVRETSTRVHIPENLDSRVSGSNLWKEYDSRCVNCGRCNFVCPTCTCFTMQDLYYTDNGKSGERRRVWASCMVDGFTDVAGGGSYRQKNGDRMRFKVLHKVLDYKKRNGYHMCVGCRRCDDICPEYISFSSCVNKLEEGMREVSTNDPE